MTLEEAVRAYLLADVDIKSAVDDRIFAEVVPSEQGPWPVIVFSRLSSITEQTLDGPGLSTIRIQFAVFSDKWLDAAGLAKLVEDKLTELIDVTQDDLTIQASFLADTRDLGYDINSGVHRLDVEFDFCLV